MEKKYKVNYFLKNNYSYIPDYSLNIFYNENEKFVTAENYRFLLFSVIGKDYFSAIRNLSITIVKKKFCKINIYNDLNELQRSYNSHL